MMLPRVTGTRFLRKKLGQVRAGKSAAVLPIAAQNDAGAPVLMSRPIGMKYILAILCSNPAATNAATGGIMARMRSVVVRALKVSQTARQTRVQVFQADVLRNG